MTSMAMSPITQYSVEPLSIPIHVPFAISKETLAAADIALVMVSDGQGLVGLGEAAPFPSLTGDDVTTAARTASDLLVELEGRTPEEALRRLEDLRQETFRRSVTAHVAVETALWDLLGRQRGKSLAALWGQVPRREITTDITLPIMPPSAVTPFWELYRSYGFSTVKIKVSGAVEADRELVHELMRNVPEGTEITLDGNQGFSVAGALELVRKLQADGIEPLFFEQPLAEDDWRGVEQLDREAPIPICLDETVRTVADAKRAIETLDRCLINLKIMKSGINATLAIARLAAEHDVSLMIGGMLESEVAMGTSLHILCGTGAIAYADLDTPFFFKQRVTEQSPWHPCQARLVLPEGAGHGLRRSAK